MPLDRPALHCAADGLDLAARKLLLQPIGVPPNAILVCFMRNEALLDEAELDLKLTRAYARPEGKGWLVSSRAILMWEAARRGIHPRDPVGIFAFQKFEAEQGAAAGLLALPPAEFFTAIEYALELVNSERRPSVCAQLQDVMKKRLLPYTIDGQGHISWVGEPAVRQLAIEPALSVLTDPRLSTARREFEDARRELRIGELTDAANDAGCAVESTMARLLDAHGRRQPTKYGKERVQAGPLFDALEGARVLDRERDRRLIFAAIDVRDPGSHGAGIKPRRTDRAYIEAGVAAAAVAITYLASKLP